MKITSEILTIMGYIFLLLQIFTIIIDHWSTVVFFIIGLTCFIRSLILSKNFIKLQKEVKEK